MGNTYTQLQTRVQSRIIDLPAAVQSEVPTLVNEALMELQRRHNFRVMEQEYYGWTLYNTRQLQQGSVQGNTVPPWGLWPTSTTVSPLPFPSNFKEWRDDPIFVRYQDGSVRFVTIAQDRHSIYGTFTEGDNSFPSVVVAGPPSDQYGDVILNVYPLPDGLSDWPDGEYRLLFPYYGYLPALVNTSDHNWLTDDTAGGRFIINKATADGFALDWDTANEQKWLGKAELEYKQVVNADKKYRLGAMNELATHARGQYQGRTRA
jgi:hypothetical protein